MQLSVTYFDEMLPASHPSGAYQRPKTFLTFLSHGAFPESREVMSEF
jgi:hypothetical protein